MTQQDTHPDATRTSPGESPTEPTTEPATQPATERTAEETRAHPWLGQSQYRSPSSTPTTGIPTQPTSQPDWYGTPATGGYGGYGDYPPATPTPTPAPKAKPGRGIGQMTAVAILAAALASGGTYAATRYATPAPSST